MRDATHSAVALRSAAAGGDNELRMGCQETPQVKISMGGECPSRGAWNRHQSVKVVRVVALTPRRRCVSNALSTKPWVMSLKALSMVSVLSIFGE